MTNLEMQQALQEALGRISLLESQILGKGNDTGSLVNIFEFELGTGDLSIKMDRSGLWVGKKTFAQATTTPPAGTAIALNGDFYPKGGVSGTFTTVDGKTVTVTRGIITSIV